jgi:hypothetical protein
MKIYLEPMIGLGIRKNRCTLCIWFLCWVAVWKVGDDK